MNTSRSCRAGCKGCRWKTRRSSSSSQAAEQKMRLFSCIPFTRSRTRQGSKERLTNMLRSGKPLKVYTTKRDNLEKFKEVARNTVSSIPCSKKEDKDGVFDVLVRADDDSKLARVIERFKFSGVDTAEVEPPCRRESGKGRSDADRTRQRGRIQRECGRA